MKVLLINSTWGSANAKDYSINVYTPEISTVWPPIGIGYIASYLEKDGHTVVIYDRNSEIIKCDANYDLVDKKMIDLLQNFSPNIVGISSTTPTIKDTFHTAQIVKTYSKNALVIAGGVHPTALPQDTLNKCKYIDVVILGEGEITMSEICSGKDLSTVSGIVYRKDDGAIQRTSKRLPIQDIDILPYPARHLFDMDFYLRPSTQIIFGFKCRGTSIVSSRGCPNACRFCAGPIISQNNVRYHSAEYTINELKMLVDDYGVEAVFFTDEMFTGNRKRVIDLCNLIIENNLEKKLQWGVQLRVDYVDIDLLQLMKKAGCVQVEYGFESGSQRILQEMGKKISVEQILYAAKITHESGLRMLANIIVGWPTETLADLKQTISLVENTSPDFVSWHEFKPLPGSSCWKYAKQRNLENNSFEMNKPFLFCEVSEHDRLLMEELYQEQLSKHADLTNTAQGLYSEFGKGEHN